jgi:hypothetical protein
MKSRCGPQGASSSSTLKTSSYVNIHEMKSVCNHGFCRDFSFGVGGLFTILRLYRLRLGLLVALELFMSLET